MKDEKGHGSEAKENATAAHQAGVVAALRKNTMPNLDRVTRGPKWLEYFGLAQRRARRMK